MAVSLHQTLNHKRLFFPKGFFLSSVLHIPPHSLHSASNSQFPVYPVRFFSFLPRESRRSNWAQEWQMSFWYLDSGSDLAYNSQEMEQLSSEMEHIHCRWTRQIIYTLLQVLSHGNCGFIKGVLLAICLLKWVNKIHFSSMTVLFPEMPNSKTFAPECVHPTLLKINRKFNVSTAFEPQQQNR